MLQERSKKLRKSVYEIDENIKNTLPAKNTIDNLDAEIKYCQDLVKAIEKNDVIAAYPKVMEKLNMLNETLEDDIHHIQACADADARIGHKSVDTSFFGYKTHIAMTEERIITAATITTGEKNDGKELETLITKSQKAGIKVKTIIGDSAYSEKGNIEFANRNNIKLVAKLNPSVTQGFRKKEDEFQFNKDAGMYVWKAPHPQPHCGNGGNGGGNHRGNLAEGVRMLLHNGRNGAGLCRGYPFGRGAADGRACCETGNGCTRVFSDRGCRDCGEISRV